MGSGDKADGRPMQSDQVGGGVERDRPLRVWLPQLRCLRGSRPERVRCPVGREVRRSGEGQPPQELGQPGEDPSSVALPGWGRSNM